ncbi:MULTISPECIES: hypothetical protein [Stenotrophomonas]|jgi:hypothetical protein|uniref:hypothetical protein n=1 Tax=Stenotrophomonas TaxID=40323 RepID=UPI000BD273C6|nr:MULTISPECIES: hypothetical protein [Stenotrophomonas]MCA7025291.1 hypothetical protein [Stenotrophomonas acidaminiphila]MCE4075258.1 hypothetical protein [Stenotrophomonas acidaminiphila]OZB52452.1 MAG: hypothetical protein B7X38_08185 [Stenotrophomonas sp. 14-69-23]WHL19344.1 hypothetical protein QLF99_02605 [Stenotrophomonas acidaminiphila]
MKAFESQLQSLKRQVEAAPWLKWAGLAIVLLLALFCLQALDAVRVERQKAAMDAELDLRRIMSLKGQDVWFEREKSALELRDTLRAQLPEVATPGMAQASLQNWLRGLTSGFGNEQNANIRINRSGTVETVPGVLRVNASLNVAASPRQSLNLLRQIESSSNLVTLETLTLQSDDSNTLHLTLNAYYRIAEGAAP